MPLLPNLGDIPQAQFDRIVAAFPGATNAEKTQAYKDWLTNRLIDRVSVVEQTRLSHQVESSLPARRPEPTEDF
jgi:hypothetical protein